MTTPLEALAYLSRQEPTYAHFQAFQAEVNAEKHDRGAAIVLATNCETCLRIAIQRNLIVVPDSFKELFRFGAPLGSFEAKIRIGFAMGVFKDQMRSNLEIIKSVRNAFAHCLIPIKFETTEVSAVCDLLVMPEFLYPHAVRADTGEPAGAIPPGASTRVKFQKICEAVSHNLLNFGVSPTLGGIPSDPKVGIRVERVMPKPLP